MGFFGARWLYYFFFKDDAVYTSSLASPRWTTCLIRVPPSSLQITTTIWYSPVTQMRAPRIATPATLNLSKIQYLHTQTLGATLDSIWPNDMIRNWRRRWQQKWVREYSTAFSNIFRLIMVSQCPSWETVFWLCFRMGMQVSSLIPVGFLLFIICFVSSWSGDVSALTNLVKYLVRSGDPEMGTQTLACY